MRRAESPCRTYRATTGARMNSKGRYPAPHEGKGNGPESALRFPLCPNRRTLGRTTAEVHVRILAGGQNLSLGRELREQLPSPEDQFSGEP